MFFFFLLTASFNTVAVKLSSTFNTFHPSSPPPPPLSLPPVIPQTLISVLPRSKWGDGHPRARHHGLEHPLQPPVHPAARPRLPPERLHPREHGHPHLQPSAAAGYGPAGHAAGAASASGLGTGWASKGRPDPRLQEEVHQEGEEVDAGGEEVEAWWSDEKPNPPCPTIRYLLSHGRCWWFFEDFLQESKCAGGFSVTNPCCA